MTKMLNRLFRDKILALPQGAMPRGLNLLDVGARDGLQWPWSHVARELLSLVLVEADDAEANRLQRKADPGDVVLPIGLWRTDENVTLNVNRSPGTSSVYPADRAFLDQFPEAERFEVVHSVELPARTVDGEAAAGRMPLVDFAKIDVQGAELAVLQGGTKHFSEHLVGLEVEVEFVRIYSGQPLFSDVDAFVREQLGLELWDLRRSYWKYKEGVIAGGPAKGRLIFGDALYFRPLTNLESWLAGVPAVVASTRVAMLMLAALAYGYLDYTHAILTAPHLAPCIGRSTRQAFEAAIGQSRGGFRPFKNGQARLWWLLNAVASGFRPTHNGWATGGEGLGSRRRGAFWV